MCLEALRLIGKVTKNGVSLTAGVNTNKIIISSLRGESAVCWFFRMLVRFKNRVGDVTRAPQVNFDL